MIISRSTACLEWLVRHYVYFISCALQGPHKHNTRSRAGGNIPASPVHLSIAVHWSLCDFYLPFKFKVWRGSIHTITFFTFFCTLFPIHRLSGLSTMFHLLEGTLIISWPLNYICWWPEKALSRLHSTRNKYWDILNIWTY